MGETKNIISTREKSLMSYWNTLLRTITLCSLIFALSACDSTQDSLVIYSARQTHLLSPITDEFTKQSGIKVHILNGKAGPLIERIKSEGHNTHADIFMTVDAGNLWHAEQEGILTSTPSSFIKSNIPSHLRDPDHHWTGISLRARTIIYNTANVTPSDLSTYEQLADPKWKGRLALRTSKKVYNQSLIAMLIKQNGETAVELMLQGWVKNLAAPVFSSDTHVIEAVASGQADVGIVNSYYVGRYQEKHPNAPIAIFWPNQHTSGVHINISGAGIVRHTSHPEHAKAFLEWLSTADIQTMFANTNYEYPANPEADISPYVMSWGSFKASEFNISDAGKYQQDAIRLMNKANYY